jgi:hypothetical protein
MNFWKPVALASIAALTLVAGSGGAQADSSAARPQVAGAQPNMETALTRLREARAALERAEHDKGGWRAAAVQATDTAIKETERGIAYGDKR